MENFPADQLHKIDDATAKNPIFEPSDNHQARFAEY
jgi:hypothetical protein